MQGGNSKLHQGSVTTAWLSIRALAFMTSVPASAAETIKADLTGLLVKAMQEPEVGSDKFVLGVVLTALYRLSVLPDGRQQLLQKLTPASSAVMIEMSLKVLEDDKLRSPGGAGMASAGIPCLAQSSNCASLLYVCMLALGSDSLSASRAWHFSLVIAKCRLLHPCLDPLAS